MQNIILNQDRVLVNAHDVKCGDIIEFREKQYCVISNVILKKRTICHITCLEQDAEYQGTVITTFRTFKIWRIGQISAKLESLSIEENDITSEMDYELQVILEQERETY